MKVVIDMHISLNGMIADSEGKEDWLPHDGWDEMKIQAQKYNNMIIGRETYEVVSVDYEENFDAVDVKLKIIVTSRKIYVAPAGYVIAHTPEDALAILRDYSMDAAYVVGGGRLNSAFMKRKLVDGLHITINPYVLGKGKNIFFPEDFEYKLKLLSTRQASLGRVVNDYEVVK